MALLYSLIATATFFGAYSLYYYLKDKKVKASRAGHTIETFVEEFSGSSYDEQAIRIAYQDLIELCGFAVRRWDSLNELGIDLETLDDLVMKRCKAAGAQGPTLEHLARVAPVDTVNDYVQFVAELLSVVKNRTVS